MHEHALAARSAACYRARRRCKTDPIEVAIIEDDAGFRQALVALLAGSPDFRCAQTAGSVEEALAAPAGAPVDVLLLDINLPGQKGSSAIPALRARHPRALVLMLTVFDEQDHVFESLCNGASGYLLKKTPPARLLEAIREARGGGSPMSPEIARKVIATFHKVRPAPAAQSLTAQQARLLALLADGHSYLSAGGQLDITVNTVRKHIRDIYEKLRVHSKSEAVSKALKQGLI